MLIGQAERKKEREREKEQGTVVRFTPTSHQSQQQHEQRNQGTRIERWANLQWKKEGPLSLLHFSSPRSLCVLCFLQKRFDSFSAPNKTKKHEREEMKQMEKRNSRDIYVKTTVNVLDL